MKFIPDRRRREDRVIPFPTPKERYDRYWTWCVILGFIPLSLEKWRKESARVPEHLPIAWNA